MSTDEITTTSEVTIEDTNAFTSEQKLLAIACHLAYLVGLPIIVPIVLLVIKKEDPFIAEHAKQALVAQGLITLAGFVCGFLTIFLIGILLMPILAILGIVFLIASFLASYAALSGKSYQYPLTKWAMDKL